MSYVIVAPVGKYMEDLYVGIKEFPTERVILISTKEYLEDASEAKKNLDKFKIPVQIKMIEGHLWEETFKAIAEIKMVEKGHELLVNVSTGDRDMRCAATSAAFVNGLKAFGIDRDKVMMLPVLKFSYYKILTDKKMELMK